MQEHTEVRMQVKVKRLTPEAKMPTYATEGSACFDLYTTSKGFISTNAVLNTGLSFEIPEGYVMLVFSRSGHGFKNDVRLANAVAVIDSDFRGEVMVKLTKDSVGVGMTVNKGDRIAQAMIVPYPKVNFLEVDELSVTIRGTGGFGSTGIQ